MNQKTVGLPNRLFFFERENLLCFCKAGFCVVVYFTLYVPICINVGNGFIPFRSLRFRIACIKKQRNNLNRKLTDIALFFIVASRKGASPFDTRDSIHFRIFHVKSKRTFAGKSFLLYVVYYLTL